jgi:transcriptional regulator with XRE-family HTH domain
MVQSTNDVMECDGGAERRQRLRVFLTQRRSGLDPKAVGLPYVQRRRVPGLRREEVAELASVSVEWYRRFERGEPIRVSCQFVYRVAQALRLSPAEAMELFCLSVPEVYFSFSSICSFSSH